MSSVWSWADVPNDTPPSEPGQLRAPGNGRPRHPVTLGDMDSTILPMARNGEYVVRIAARVGCGPWLITRRLRALGVECWR